MHTVPQVKLSALNATKAPLTVILVVLISGAVSVIGFGYYIGLIVLP